MCVITLFLTIFTILKDEVRDLLLLVFWLRHYLPIRALGVLFMLPKTTVHRILMTQLNCVYERVQEYISLDNWDANDAPKGWPGHVAIVDGTEVFINC